MPHKEEITELFRKQRLVDIDNNVVNYIQENIAFPFEFEKRRVEPKVLYGKPERSQEQKAKGHYKVRIDGNHYNLPVISVYRIGIDVRNNQIPHWLSDEQLSYEIGKIFNKKYNESEAGITYVMERRPVKADVQYDVRIISSNQAYNNMITEQFILNEGKHWGGWVNYPSISDSSTSADQNTERIISSSLNLTFRGYILPEISKNQKIDYKKYPTIKNVYIGESIIAKNDLDEMFED